MATTPPIRRAGRRISERLHPIDVLVGSRLRLRRKMLGLSQQQLGEALGLAFQQVQKYELGTNRIGASRLYQLTRALDVPISFFFDPLDPVRAPAIPSGIAEPATEAFDLVSPRRTETVELVEAYYAIDPPALKRRLLDLAKALAGHNAVRSRARNSAPTRRRKA